MSDRRRVIDDRLYCHFITFSCDRRRRLLDLDCPKRILMGQLNDQLERQKARCVGFVIMPDHVHAVVWFPEAGQLSRFVHGWKRLSSYAIRQWYRQQKARYFHTTEPGTRVWTPKYYAFQIDSSDKLEEKLTYMHMNPVRAGLVERAVDWPWSSARWYETRRSVGVPIDWVH
ncbi:Transposase IS200 like protein [Maioricimonas rarisocia]|uniref:Transposase IS200 like protein n=1 Tax=Maioricimonas rarisocia TaxID=2528026 RepID=A0A517ZFN1_9PLAN|nr:transposase [Maioricimonas rarisocia]QDU41298.1 Transposase IS200 like protein [Maioricimonas rarisocia]